MKIRYKYKSQKEGVKLEDIRCPVCGNKSTNWIKSVNSIDWDGSVCFVAECWSGDTSQDKPKHIFLIKIARDTLPTVEIEKIKTRIKK